MLTGLPSQWVILSCISAMQREPFGPTICITVPHLAMPYPTTQTNDDVLAWLSIRSKVQMICICSS